MYTQTMMNSHKQFTSTSEGWMVCRRRKYYYWEDGIQIAIGSILLKFTWIEYITHSADISCLEKYEFPYQDLPPHPPPCLTVSPPSLPTSIKHSPAILRQNYPQLHHPIDQLVTRCSVATITRVALRRGVSMARVNDNRCARKPLEEWRLSKFQIYSWTAYLLFLSPTKWSFKKDSRNNKKIWKRDKIFVPIPYYHHPGPSSSLSVFR